MNVKRPRNIVFIFLWHCIIAAHKTLHETDMHPRPKDNKGVRTWLTAIGEGDLYELFKAQRLDMELILTLNDDTLKEIGVETFGQRQKIKRAISDHGK